MPDLFIKNTYTYSCENLATTDANVAGPDCDILWDSSTKARLNQSQVL